MGVATIKVKSQEEKAAAAAPTTAAGERRQRRRRKEAGKRKKRKTPRAARRRWRRPGRERARTGGRRSRRSWRACSPARRAVAAPRGGAPRAQQQAARTGSGRRPRAARPERKTLGAAPSPACGPRTRRRLPRLSPAPARNTPGGLPLLGLPAGFLAPRPPRSCRRLQPPSSGFGAAPAPPHHLLHPTTSAAAPRRRRGPPPGSAALTLNSVARAPAPPRRTASPSPAAAAAPTPSCPARARRPAPSPQPRPRPPPAAAAAAARRPRRDAEAPQPCAMLARVRRAVPLDDFLQLSALYRQGALPAATFRSHCRHLLGEEAFADVFPELLALLPDIAKQQVSSGSRSPPELMAAHEEEEGPGSLPIQVCASCGQVLASGDLRHHQASHRLENHFASTTLDKASTTVASAWDSRK
ncbi:Uncharacterized protein GBIM_08897 [Gryllus bimaculatus]|nr:Uncharacterized protein GBIM_08897 [Gryllus bimaculatus]